MKSVLAAISALALTAPLAAQPRPEAEQIWRSDNAARPEAVHVPADGIWAYIGNQAGNGEDGDPPGQGYVPRLNLHTGEFQDRWAEGFNDPLGIVSQDDTLIMIDDGNAVIAFYNHLNTNSKFAGDGLALLPGDIVHGPKVRQLLAAIVDDYLRRGWTVS